VNNKPLHQIIDDYRKREQKGKVVKRVISPTIKNIGQSFKRIGNEKKQGK
tara:strand:+ start:48 stop:197 length:150 start_codon:yes stop_codon:yes gene_type:complete